MEQMFYNADAFNQPLSRWDVSSVTNMRYMFYDADAFNKDILGWDTSRVTDSIVYFCSADAWHARFEAVGGNSHTLPDRGWTRRDDACDASLPPVNGDVGNCTDTLASGTSCVPECNTGFVPQGVTTCTNRVLTETLCTLDVTTRSELKVAVDACVGDRLCELTMPHWNVSRVTNMSFLFEGKTSFDVDISQWEMSQVTNVQGMFHGASRFDQDISQWEMSQVTNAQGMFHGASRFDQGITGWTLASGAKTTGMFTGADTWLSRGHRGDDSDTTDGPPSAWVASGLCLENERVQSGWCVACGAGKYNGPGDDPALGVDTDCDGFGTLATLKTAVTNCLAVDPTGVACCSHGADCGAAGTTEMADWDVSMMTSMRELFYGKSQFNADISRWDTSRVTDMYRMFRDAGAFSQRTCTP